MPQQDPLRPPTSPKPHYRAPASSPQRPTHALLNRAALLTLLAILTLTSPASAQAAGPLTLVKEDLELSFLAAVPLDAQGRT